MGRAGSGLAETLPWAAVTFDEFHVIQLVNQAVDEVRRQEAKSTPSLKRSRYLWLKDKAAWTGRQIAQFADLRQFNLKTHRAFRIKEALRAIFHSAPSREDAEPLLDQWYSWARRCRLEPIKQVAKTLKDHWAGTSSTPSTPNSPTAASRPPTRSSRRGQGPRLRHRQTPHHHLLPGRRQAHPPPGLAVQTQSVSDPGDLVPWGPTPCPHQT